MPRLGVAVCLLFLLARRCVGADNCEEDKNNKGCVCVLDKKNVDLRSLANKQDKP